MLLVSDEVICAFGRLGYWFGAQRYGYQPDIITVAKGMTQRLLTDRRDARVRPADRAVPQGRPRPSCTASPSPATRCRAAVALANLDIFEREGLLEHVRANEAAFRATLESQLGDLPIVGDVRGDGYFYGIELVKDKATKETFNDDESERLLRGFLSGALFEAGLVCRADDRGDPVIQLAPPLICDQQQFDEIEQVLRSRAHRGLVAGCSRSTSPDPDPTAARQGRRRPQRHARHPRRGLVAHVGVAVDGQPFVMPGRPRP